MADGKLSALKIARLKEPGLHADGGGLYLQVAQSATGKITKSWVYRFMLNGRARYMGLGPLALYGLAEARQRALEARKLRHDGIDPIERRRALRAQERLEVAKAVTFQECAESYIAAHRAGWRNARHAAQWPSTLAAEVYPTIGNLSVAAIDTSLVMRVIEPIWNVKPETASRVRGRIECILDWAKVRGYRDGENPARWRGHLDHLLPRKTKVRRIEHHEAMPYGEVTAFLTELCKQESIAARALEFGILTAARTGEVLGAIWAEIDIDAKLWTIPAGRMKGGREHRAPLSDPAIELLKALPRDDGNPHVFIGGRHGKPLSGKGLLELLRRMGHDTVTVHGFRAAFKTWATERTAFANEVVEMALAHAVGTAVEAAYRRTDLFDRRRKLLDAWASFCTQPPSSAGAVIPMRANATA